MLACVVSIEHPFIQSECSEPASVAERFFIQSRSSERLQDSSWWLTSTYTSATIMESSKSANSAKNLGKRLQLSLYNYRALETDRITRALIEHHNEGVKRKCVESGHTTDDKQGEVRAPDPMASVYWEAKTIGMPKYAPGELEAREKERLEFVAEP